MQPVVFVAPAALGVVLLVFFGLPARLRAAGSDNRDEQAGDVRFGPLQAIGVVGALLGLWIALSASDEPWRTTLAERIPTAFAGAAIGCAWVLAVILDPGRRGWRTAALVAAGSSALVLAATNQWLVPTLLFWGCSSLAVAALASDSPARGLVWPTIAASDAAFAAGLIAHAVSLDSWALRTPIEGWPAVLVGVAGVLRAGVVPHGGAWALLDSRGAPALPLLLGGAFTLTSGRAIGAWPWVAVVLLLVALLGVVRNVRSDAPDLSSAGAWIVAVALALSLAVPAATGSAGIAAVLAVSALALWPSAPSGGQGERGLMISLVPATAGFGALALVGREAFGRVQASGSVFDSLPWGLLGALLLAALLSGALLGTRLARLPGTMRFHPLPDVALWALLAAGALVDASAPAGLSQTLAGSAYRAIPLHLAAVVFGVAVALAWGPLTDVLRARLAHVRPPPQAPPPAEQRSFELRLWSLSAPAQRTLVRASGFLGAAVAVAIAWFTIEGLRQGFL